MAKVAPKKEASPAKSRKPQFPGCNSIKDFPKAFRSHANKGLLKGLCGVKKRTGYISDSAKSK